MTGLDIIETIQSCFNAGNTRRCQRTVAVRVGELYSLHTCHRFTCAMLKKAKTKTIGFKIQRSKPVISRTFRES